METLSCLHKLNTFVFIYHFTICSILITVRFIICFILLCAYSEAFDVCPAKAFETAFTYLSFHLFQRFWGFVTSSSCRFSNDNDFYHHGRCGNLGLTNDKRCER